MKKIIYDFGSNNGDDISYYLMKSDRVVAVEANPTLCKQIRTKFNNDISLGNLVVVNCVMTATEDSEQVPFYIHKTNHVLSQFPRPSSEVLQQYTEVMLPSMSVARIINEYGTPFYIKIDIEHYDTEILHALDTQKIFPPYISAESHSVKVFCTMVNMGYDAFKLVDGNSVQKQYSARLIQTDHESVVYSFPHHSAGPFGNDIDGEWMTADNFFLYLAFEGLGWRDIHASRIDPPNLLEKQSFKQQCLKKIRRNIKTVLGR